MTDQEKGPDTAAGSIEAPVKEGEVIGNVPGTDVSDNSERVAQAYIDCGWRLVRILRGDKKPVSERGWPNAEPAARDFLPGDNIGVQLGAKSGHLVDVDLDIPQARALSGLGCFFGHLPSFRRASLPPDAPGHRLVVCKDAPNKRVAFDFSRDAEKEQVAALGLPKTVVLELRAGKCYSVFPPSVIDNDDSLVWNHPPGGSTTIPEMAWDDLRRRGGLLAFCAIALAAYPDRGSRDEYCLHLAGALLHAGVEIDHAGDIIFAVARLAGDEEAAARRGKAAHTAERKQSGENVTGLPAFLALTGLAKCEKRIRDWLGMDEKVRGDEIPADAILVGRPEIHAFVDDVEQAALARLPEQIFRNNGRLARLSTLDAEDNRSIEGVKRHAGIKEIVGVNPSWLRVALSRAGVAFYKIGAKAPALVAPPNEVGILLSRPDETPFPHLRGISMTPTLRRDAPGYDAESRLYLAFEDDAFPQAPEPTRANAEAALDRLKHPLREFPFASAASLSVVLSMFLCAVVRGELETCPMHCTDAPSPGSGKTKLSIMAGIIATGVEPSHATFTSSNEEMEKRLAAILLCGDPVINLDNVDHPLEGTFLCQMLTSTTVQSRILGVSEMARLNTRALMLATGNNIRLKGDMVRRAVVCRIDAQCERPDQREFDFDPVEEVRENRPQFVIDALTVLRAYVGAGRPLPASYVTLGSFDDYDLIRGALLWLGEADPVETQKAAFEQDEEREKRVVVLKELWRQFGREHFYARQVDHEGQNVIAEYLPGEKWSARKAGKLFAAVKDRPCGSLTLRGGDDGHGTTRWRLEGDGGARGAPF